MAPSGRISPRRFHASLAERGVDFAVGVPDSLLKEFCSFAASALTPDRHLIAANEGAAIAIASGAHLATGSVPLVYMQNSGLGNAVNPLLSLADPEVYGIPMVVLVGWRGEPGVPDEPQHVKQGRVSTRLLDAMEVPWRALSGDPGEADEIAAWAVGQARQAPGPVVVLARAGVFEKAPGTAAPSPPDSPGLRRERAIEVVTECLPPETTIVSTTGKISRELHEIRLRRQQRRDADFLTVGSMGHASQIALGIALSQGAPVACLDGDGAVLMHMGGVATIGAARPDGLLHVVLNNGVHDSVGGQPTVGRQVRLTEVASACGYPTVIGPVEAEEALRSAVCRAASGPSPAFVEVRVLPGARGDLGRPQDSPAENKARFVARLSGSGQSE